GRGAIDVEPGQGDFGVLRPVELDAGGTSRGDEALGRGGRSRVGGAHSAGLPAEGRLVADVVDRGDDVERRAAQRGGHVQEIGGAQQRGIKLNVRPAVDASAVDVVTGRVRPGAGGP